MSHVHAYVPSFLYIPIYWFVWCFFACLSFSLSLSLFWLVASWHLNENPLHPRTLFILEHPLPLNPLLFMFGSVMRRPVRTSWRTFLDEAFIRNTKSSYRTFSILTFPLSSTVGVGSHYLASRHMPFHDHTAVLLEHAWIWLPCTLFHHSRSRYTHCSHFRSYIWGDTRSKGRVCWPPQLWLS